MLPTAFTGNKICINIIPPAPRANILMYKVFWDKGLGTVYYTDEYKVGEVTDNQIDASFNVWTLELMNGSYKFVVRTVSLDGNEDQNTTEQIYAIRTFPHVITNLAYRFE